MAYQFSSDPRPFAGMRNVISKVCPGRECMLGATTGSRQRGQGCSDGFSIVDKETQARVLAAGGRAAEILALRSLSLVTQKIPGPLSANV